MDAITQTSDVADVLVIGAGPSGGMVTHVLSQTGLDVVCLEQGDWVASSDFPTNRPEWELLVQKRWAHHPNERNVAADYAPPPHPLGPLGLTAARGLNKLGWHWWPGTVAIPSARFGELAQCERWGTCEWGCPRGSKASADVAFWVHNLRSGARLVTGARVREILVDSAGRARGAAW